MGKDKPQKMQNYSHFVVDGEWEPISKGNKKRITELLLNGKFPEMAAISTSGQKHVAFRARRNPPGQRNGWIQLEETVVWVDHEELRQILEIVEDLYRVFSKGEIETGDYSINRIITFGMDKWEHQENKIKPIRNASIFKLALYIAQRSENEEQQSNNDSDDAQNDLARNTHQLQKPISHDDLGAVHKRNKGGSLHKQPGQVHQPDLFAATSQPGE